MTPISKIVVCDPRSTDDRARMETEIAKAREAGEARGAKVRVEWPGVAATATDMILVAIVTLEPAAASPPAAAPGKRQTVGAMQTLGRARR
jgi:hypothetical protein